MTPEQYASLAANLYTAFRTTRSYGQNGFSPEHAFELTKAVVREVAVKKGAYV